MPFKESVMNFRDQRRYDMLIRVRNFGIAHAPLFPPSSTAHAAFAVVTTEVAQIETLDLAERQASHSARSERKESARQLLVESLSRAKYTARDLARSIPELAAQGEWPNKPNDRLLLTVARQFLTAAAPYAAQFAGHGIAIADLDTQTRAFDAAMSERGQQREEQKQARSRIETSMARALEAAATLDVIVGNQFAGDPVVLETWKRDRMLARPRRSAAVAEKPAATPAVETPAVAVPVVEPVAETAAPVAEAPAPKAA
jgi:hypothetical protein